MIDESKFKKYTKIPVTIEAYRTETEETIENQEGLLLGNVPTIQFNLIVDLMDARTKLHNRSNQITGFLYL